MSARSDRHLTPKPNSAPPAASARATKAGPASPGSGVTVNSRALPPKPDEMSWRDYLIMLLHIASELEHALMVEYLYSAYSLGGEESATHADMVRDWRDTLLTVAREEMGHLITVQNLLLLVGGPVSFERRDYPWSSPFYPFEFKLEPLTLRALACYVYAEMPATMLRSVDKDVRARVLEIIGSNAPTVGEIYEKIIELLGNSALIPDSMFDADSYKYQATWDEWGRGYRPDSHKPYAEHPTAPPPYARKTRVIVAQMATRTEAVAAMQDVAGQGEAEHLKPADRMEDSHFDRFAKVFRSYERILGDDPGWTPSRPIPENPFAGDAQSAPAGTTPIAHPASLAWAGLFNIRYRTLLSLLTYMFHIPRDAVASTHPRRAQILSRIFGEMYNMKAVAGIVVRLPLGSPDDAARAGPPFQLPYTLTPPFPEANFWRMHLDLLDASDALVQKLLHSKEHHLPETPADGTRYLHALHETDRDARNWIAEILAGLDLTRRARA